jgi:hypothetical protein
MRISEKAIRRIIRRSLEEMALKSMQVGLPRPMATGQETPVYMTPEEYAASDMSIDQPSWTSQESHAAAMKTWGRKSYESYAKNQFERLPIGLNVFVLPKTGAMPTYRRFTDPDDDGSNRAGMNIIRQHFPDAQIDPDDLNIVILTPHQEELSARTGPVTSPADFLRFDGIYNTVHALFDSGPLGDICDEIREDVSRIAYLIAGVPEGEFISNEKLSRVIGSRTNQPKSPLNSIFRLKTLRSGRLNDEAEIAPELCTVALIRNTIPVNVDSFPAENIDGVEFTPEEFSEGMSLLEDISMKLEGARDAWQRLQGKTIIGSPENLP